MRPDPHPTAPASTPGQAVVGKDPLPAGASPVPATAACLCSARYPGQDTVAVLSGGIRLHRPLLIGDLLEIRGRAQGNRLPNHLLEQGLPDDGRPAPSAGSAQQGEGGDA